MTEKRFKVTNISENGNTGLFWLGKDNLSVYDVVRVLNELYDENIELHIQLDFLKDENQHMKSVLKENKELKEQLKDCTKKAKEEIRKQKEENAIRWANI